MSQIIMIDICCELLQEISITMAKDAPIRARAATNMILFLKAMMVGV